MIGQSDRNSAANHKARSFISLTRGNWGGGRGGKERDGGRGEKPEGQSRWNKRQLICCLASTNQFSRLSHTHTDTSAHTYTQKYTWRHTWTHKKNTARTDLNTQTHTCKNKETMPQATNAVTHTHFISTHRNRPHYRPINSISSIAQNTRELIGEEGGRGRREAKRRLE